MLGVIFLCRGISAAAGVPLHFACHEEDTVQALLPPVPPRFEGVEMASWQTLCAGCQAGFPHTCHAGLGLLPHDFLREQLRGALVSWRDAHPEAEFDEAAIHVRCGDILRCRLRVEYGFSPYQVYLETIPSD
eukprot:10836188-Prorocentrum_lima.AAC.1